MKKYPLVYLTVIFLGINLCGSFNVYVNDDKGKDELSGGCSSLVLLIILILFRRKYIAKNCFDCWWSDCSNRDCASGFLFLLL